ncbi:GNAT family N-acetyltransferase [Streptomyces sp. MUM 178J]|uniref:GNAT family N-acetyltransferase n=1 Tax=Streptomyces sp. MUM 178J TaxID=2791991 RepID=UPI001F038C3D|nr:GNAT family N-acetyltransferase [Streptomyces sp. MUM 178J]WRQ79191.1 GNAT family N-acetyltransferase [Streptomyces sp. MUM 178J]
MPWQLSEDVEEFRREADEHLAAEAARATTLLTVSETVRRHGTQVYGGPACFGWWRRGPGAPAEAAFLQTPPWPPALGPMPDRLAAELAGQLRSRGARLPGVRGGDRAARAFADAWAGPGGWQLTGRIRLFRLGALTPPHPAPPGRARQASGADLDLAASWLREFAAAVGVTHAMDYAQFAEQRIAEGSLHLWERPDGRPVSMAAHSTPLAGQSRISHVYTPPPLRGRGYAAGATAAVTRAALAVGAQQVLLFTDLANPTSNALYQRLGYRPLADHAEIAFL